MKNLLVRYRVREGHGARIHAMDTIVLGVSLDGNAFHVIRALLFLGARLDNFAKPVSDRITFGMDLRGEKKLRLNIQVPGRDLNRCRRQAPALLQTQAGCEEARSMDFLSDIVGSVFGEEATKPANPADIEVPNLVHCAIRWFDCTSGARAILGSFLRRSLQDASFRIKLPGVL